MPHVCWELDLEVGSLEEQEALNYWATPPASKMALRILYYYYVCVHECVWACMPWLKYGGQRVGSLLPFYMSSGDQTQVGQILRSAK